MNSDLLKRERIREALAARLLQLSKKCEEICTPSTSESVNSAHSVKSEVFRLNFPSPADEMVLSKSDCIVPLMINNFITPSLIPAHHEPNKNWDGVSFKNKAFRRDVMSSSGFSITNSSPDPSGPGDIVLEDAQELFDGERCSIVETPSTDLDNYMNYSTNSTESHSIRSASSASDKTSLSEVDHVTVVSLTSDTESQESLTCNESARNSPEIQPEHTNKSPLQAGLGETSFRVLNEITEITKGRTETQVVTHTNNSELNYEKTPRRRRLSYTLETPSPFLEKAMKNRSIGPESEATFPKQVSDSDVVNDDTNVHLKISCLERSEKSPDLGTNVHLKLCYLNRSQNSPDLLTKEATGSQKSPYMKGCSSPKSRIPVMGGIRPNSVLLGLDQQLANLDSRHQSLRQYLDQLNSTPSPQTSPKHQQRNSSGIASLSSPTVPSRAVSYSEELKSLREEISQQRLLLTEQMQRLQDLTLKQEGFFHQMLSTQREQMTKLQLELSHQLQNLFSQHSLAVQSRLCSLETTVCSLIQERWDKTGLIDTGTDGTDAIVSQVQPVVQAESLTPGSRNYQRLVIPLVQVSSPEVIAKFDKVSAAVKGYLTRRLLKTEKVQSLIQTIKDTMECALKIHEIANINAQITKDDAELHQRLINQVTSACHAFHDVFFKYSVEQRMQLIAHSRQLQREKAYKTFRQLDSRPFISSATMKSLERKQFAKSKSVSPNAGRRKWREPKRPSTSTEVKKIPKSSPSPHRNLSWTPPKDRTQRPKQAKGEARSPSFYR